MGKKSGPAPPDPADTIAAEAEANRVNTYLPGGGGIRYGWTGPNGAFREGTPPQGRNAAVRVNETPFQKNIRQDLQPAARRAASNIRGAVTGLGASPDAPTAADFSGTPAPDGFGWNQEIADAMFERTSSLLQPQIEQQSDRLFSNLQARGLPPGSEAFNRAYGEHTRNVGDIFSRLSMDALLAAGQEDSRRFAQQGTARDRAVGEGFSFYNAARGERDATFNELASTLGGSFTPSSPVAPAVPQINAAGAINAQYAGQQANAQRSQNAWLGGLNGLTTIGGAALLASSRDIKVHLGDVDPHWALDVVEKMPIAIWAYDETSGEDPRFKHIGPYAEDFHEATETSADDGIFPTDPAGLALAAIKSLSDQVRRLQSRIAIMEAHA